MKELRINPNPPRNSHEETGWLERDQAALHHLDCDRDPDAPEGDASAPAPVRPRPAAIQPNVEPRTPPAPDAAGETPLPGSLPPLLASLLTTLPPPGAAWSSGQRLDWLRAAEDIFHLVYKTEGRLRIEADE